MLSDTQKRRRRILVVSNLFPPHVLGGAEVVARRQALGIAASGHDVVVFTGRIAESVDARGRLDREDDDGMVIWRTSLTSFEANDNFRNDRVAEHFRAILNAEQPDLVHFHNMAGLGMHLIPLARRRGVPVVVTLHDLWGVCYRGTKLRDDGSICGNTEECGTHCSASIHPHDLAHSLPIRLRRDYIVWCLGHASALVSPSASLADAYVNAGAAKRDRTFVISNGIDLSPFRELKRVPSTMTRFLCVAYMGEHKGIPDLIEAARCLAADVSLKGRWSLTIAGDGHLLGDIQRKIVDYGLGEFVQSLGRVPRERVVELMSTSDVIVLPSRWPENEPVSLLEAMAAGMAQLATDVGGNGALIEPGKTGMLVPPWAPDRLAEGMRAYIAAPERAREEGQRNIARRERYAEEATVARLLDLYEDVLADPRSLPSESVVVCAGGAPASEVLEAVQSLHQAEDEIGAGRRVRLVWHGWLSPDAWAEAAAFWNWSRDIEFAPALQAIRWGLPIIVPAECRPLTVVGQMFGGIRAMDSIDGVPDLLASIAIDPAVLPRAWNSRGAADMLATIAPQASFHLPCPDIWP
ncbi:glycosyltransferase family 4 protein [Burkholderia multivorans]|uniref:glycosyltransferase family 4 protein n=1 Tax=Burkholderia multivorans TaxID=87883 RepID=UPI0009B8D54C|nr:glycosyltransferase family 4 protein [Burkholderia multivorans]MBR8107328.1 glycosyltransferase family 4 protein [Burkholderia multivorans]MBR8340373.1 glycosyltransferase family 4 protein [Burkholderia multivorans]MBU9461157.1 glycosyltransferase family 4 protein [Burkholderia multivorans]MBU9568820.1 glycosyltransferase family 4 protein [Burkholderia multivorans]MBU9590090.1 glycosyltransferase family 4 protein [Burkholderia multivorans]